jgi:hypothetical protein
VLSAPRQVILNADGFRIGGGGGGGGVLMDEFFRAISSIARLIQEGSKERDRSIRVVVLMVMLAVTVIAIAGGLTIMLKGPL